MSLGLTPDSTLNEVFEHIRVEGDLRVIPVTLKQDAKDTRQMILLQGDHEMVSIMMAQLMTTVQDMSDTAAQQGKKDDESRIVLPGA